VVEEIDMSIMRQLNRLAAGTAVAALAAFAGVGLAQADGMRGSVKDCCGFDWRGFYFGGQIGLSNVEIDRDIVGSPFWATGPGGSGSFEQDANGRLTFGGHLGYNFTSGPFVFGIEASLADVLNRELVVSPFFPASDRWRGDINYLTTVTGRLGYAMNKTLLYVKGGYAGAEVESTVTDMVTNVGGICGPAVNFKQCRSGDNSQWHHGWTAGVGVEHAVTKNVIVGFEYNFTDLGSENSITPTSAAAGTIFLNQDVDVQIHSFMGRISYKFGDRDRLPLK
jgi:outer membrane immunogenic protein